jgi:hypothetical protein
MLTEYRQLSPQRAAKEYPTEWTCYPADADTDHPREEQVEVSNPGNATTVQTTSSSRIGS